MLGAQQLHTGASSLATRPRSLTAGAGTAADGATPVADGVAALDAGAAGLHSGAQTLNARCPPSHRGEADRQRSPTLATGTRQVADGTADLAANTPALASGLTEARDGAATLGDKLADGAQQIPQDDGTERTARADAVSSPVTVDSAHIISALVSLCTKG